VSVDIYFLLGLKKNDAMKDKTSCSKVDEYDKKINELREKKRSEITALKKILKAFEKEELKSNVKSKK